MSERLAVVGDVHGRLDKLEAALASTAISGRVIVFVGDYINRGPDSRGVIDRLIQIQSETRLNRPVFLRGNHEALLLRWLQHDDRDPFIRAGGLATVKSYSSDRAPGALDRFIVDFPASHLQFLETTLGFYEEPGLLVSHAGFDPARPSRRDSSAMVFGERGRPLVAGSLECDNNLVVFGHYVQGDGRPRVDHPLYCIDTGCGTLPDGSLSVLLLPELTFIQF